MVAALDAYLARSLVMEQSLVADQQELAAVMTGTRPDLGGDLEAQTTAQHLAEHARAVAGCATGRWPRPSSPCQAGLCDHAAVLVTGSSEGGS